MCLVNMCPSHPHADVLVPVLLWAARAATSASNLLFSHQFCFCSCHGLVFFWHFWGNFVSGAVNDLGMVQEELFQGVTVVQAEVSAGCRREATRLFFQLFLFFFLFLHLVLVLLILLFFLGAIKGVIMGCQHGLLHGHGGCR